MDVHVAVAVQAGKPLEVMTVQLEGRRSADRGQGDRHLPHR